MKVEIELKNNLRRFVRQSVHVWCDTVRVIHGLRGIGVYGTSNRDIVAATQGRGASKAATPPYFRHSPPHHLGANNASTDSDDCAI